MAIQDQTVSVTGTANATFIGHSQLQAKTGSADVTDSQIRPTHHLFNFYDFQFSEINDWILRQVAASADADWIDNGGNLSTTSSLNVENDAYFANTVTASLGYSGSHTRLIDGTSAFIAGANVTITSESNGSVTIAAAAGGGGGADPGAAYILIGNTSSLANERALTAGTGIHLLDGGADSTATLSVDDDLVATLSSSVSFAGSVAAGTDLSSSGTISNYDADVQINKKSYLVTADQNSTSMDSFTMTVGTQASVSARLISSASDGVADYRLDQTIKQESGGYSLMFSNYASGSTEGADQPILEISGSGTTIHINVSGSAADNTMVWSYFRTL